MCSSIMENDKLRKNNIKENILKIQGYYKFVENALKSKGNMQVIKASCEPRFFTMKMVKTIWYMNIHSYNITTKCHLV